MLGLKLATDPRWVNIVETNISEILTDHAYCEQKAATNALSIMISYPYHTDLVDEMLTLAKEELTHFEMGINVFILTAILASKPNKQRIMPSFAYHQLSVKFF